MQWIMYEKASRESIESWKLYCCVDSTSIPCSATRIIQCQTCIYFFHAWPKKKKHSQCHKIITDLWHSIVTMFSVPDKLLMGSQGHTVLLLDLHANLLTNCVAISLYCPALLCSHPQTVPCSFWWNVFAKELHWGWVYFILTFADAWYSF